MNDYLSKPVQVQELYNVVNSANSVATDVNEDKPEDVWTDDVIDLAAFLSSFGDDRKLATKMGTMFLELLPDNMSEIRDSVVARDGEALWHAAHKFKGSVGMFSTDASDLAAALELIGRSSELDDVDEAYAALKEEVAHLNSVLTEFLHG